MQAAFPHTFIFYLKANGKREDPFFSLQPRRPATQKQEPCLLSFSCLLTAPAPTCILIELTTELEESKKLSKKTKSFLEPYFPQFLRFLNRSVLGGPTLLLLPKALRLDFPLQHSIFLWVYFVSRKRAELLLSLYTHRKRKYQEDAMLTLLLLLATPRGAFALYPPSVHHASCTNASSLLLILDTFSVPRISVDVILFCLSNHIKT